MPQMDEKIKRKELAILQTLAEAQVPLSGSDITNHLADSEGDLSERTVRLYLQRMDEDGLTEARGKQGRVITERGRSMLDSGRLIKRLGYMSAKIDRVTYSMSFDLALRRGTVIINTAIIRREDFLAHLESVCAVFEKGYAMGTLVNVLEEGREVGGIVIPEGSVGFCTVCSVTLNGMLLKHGIPTRSLFSGLLELEAGEARRFVDFITYDGTTMDPLQLFIRARMTDYLGAIRDGNGRIGAGFREIPEESYDLAQNLARKLTHVGLGAFLSIGKPSRDLLNIPVRDGCCGVIVIGGLNPVAIFEEQGVPVRHFAISGFMEYNELFPWYEMRERLLK